MQKKLNVAITGAGGLLGSRLAIYLQNQPQFNVISFFHKPKNEGEPSFDLTALRSSQSKLKDVDVVIHCAGMPDKECEANQEQCFAINSQGTLALYESSVQNRVPLFIFLSTVHVYGSPLAGNLVEDAELNPKSNYAQSKALAENLLKKAQSKTKIVVLRLSNFFGCPTTYDAINWNLLIPNLCYQAVKLERIHLNSTGEGIRNFAPITSLEKIMTELIEKQESFESYNIFNFGSAQNYTIKEIAQLVQKTYQNMSGQKIEISFGDYQDPSNVEFIFDTKKIRSKLSMNELSLEHEIKNIFNLLTDLKGKGHLP